MTTRSREWVLNGIAAVCWVLAVAGFVYTAVTRVRLHGDQVGFGASEAVVYGAALFSSATVGLVLAVRQRRHRVGWLFLALGVALSVGAAGDTYALAHGVVNDDPSDASGLALVAGRASFIAWFALIAVVLHLTPTGQPRSNRSRHALSATVVAALIALVAKAVQDTPFEEPFSAIHNPWAIRSVSGLVDVVAGVAITVTMIGLLVAAAGLVVRFRRAEGEERQQLRWMALVAVPVPLFVVVSVLSAAYDLPVLRTVATGGVVALIPIAAGLSVLRYRLYAVDRFISRAAGYAMSSGALAALYFGLGAGIGRLLGGLVDDAAVPAALAAAIVVGVALPMHRQLQEVIDKRFDRRRFEAHRLVDEYIRAPSPTRTLEETLGDALHDPSLRIGYWLSDRGLWVTDDGRSTRVSDDDIEIARNNIAVARLRVGPGIDRRIAAQLAGDAVSELDNVRLRAEVALQLVEVRESRGRIVAAQAAERHRIERNLHDGAQQRLLALAMQIRAAQLHDDLRQDNPTDELLELAVDELTAAIRELRELANGLHPAALTQGGLRSALDELAGRVPLDVELDVSEDRFDPSVEEALWFVACEAVANAAKHADAQRIWLTVTHDPGVARLACRDDGRGGADWSGTGLRGLADRVEAAGGVFVLASRVGAGTTIEAVVPCEL